jgi:hypothetical protein
LKERAAPKGTSAFLFWFGGVEDRDSFSFLSQAKAADELYGATTDETTVAAKVREADRARLRRDRDKGREFLHRRRVLPWALWEGGALPGDWCLTAEFAQGVHWWREDSILAPVAPEPVTMQQELRRYLAPEAEERRPRLPSWLVEPFLPKMLERARLGLVDE